MKNENLEYRMYSLVAYQLCGTIHAGIQALHAVVEYGRGVHGIKEEEEIYNKWADEDKTMIILNGGTTNNNPNRLGTLNQYLTLMEENGVLVKTFTEPDLGDQLTAIAFLVDERVWSKTLYPDYISQNLPIIRVDDKIQYGKWVENIGGAKNEFLRDFLSKLRLA
jgi:hypothetical protein